MAKEIELTRGCFAIVDDEDYEYLNQFKWHCNSYGYAIRNQHYYTLRKARTSKPIAIHREIMKAPKGQEVDHKNHNKLDNRKCNLRLCTKSQNNMNRKRIRAISGFKGVTKAPDWENRKAPWRAIIIKDRRVVHLGRFKEKIEAVNAYKAAAKIYFGEFAYA